MANVTIGDITVATSMAEADLLEIETAGGVSKSITKANAMPAASATLAGRVELAIIAEIDTGTDTTIAITPAGLAGSALQTKVDGIEALADVTDVTNVTAAGALMDSEVTSLVAIKDVILTSGLTIAANWEVADQTKFDAIEALADVTDTTNVTSAGALMDSELTSIADVKALDQSVVSGASPAFVGTNISGTAASLTSGTVTTNANLTGDVASVGNATTIAAKAVDVAMLADGTDGELITWSASGVAAVVAVGTVGQVLTSGGVGVAPTMQTLDVGYNPFTAELFA